MSRCGDGCGAKAVEASSTPEYVRALWLVVAMNGAMFLFGLIASVLSRSVSIRADMLDFLGDAVATGVGLLLVGRSPRQRANASLAQGFVLGMLGVFALVTALSRFSTDTAPEAFQMGVYGVLGFAVNVGAALLLLRHRDGDANVRAIWLYSRNDALANVAILVAAAAVTVTNSNLPDIIAGSTIALLFAHSAYTIMSEAWHERTELRVE